MGIASPQSRSSRDKFRAAFQFMPSDFDFARFGHKQGASTGERGTFSFQNGPIGERRISGGTPMSISKTTGPNPTSISTTRGPQPTSMRTMGSPMGAFSTQVADGKSAPYYQKKIETATKLINEANAKIKKVKDKYKAKDDKKGKDWKRRTVYWYGAWPRVSTLEGKIRVWQTTIDASKAKMSLATANDAQQAKVANDIISSLAQQPVDMSALALKESATQGLTLAESAEEDLELVEKEQQKQLLMYGAGALVLTGIAAYFLISR